MYKPEGFTLITDQENPDTIIIQDENENEFVWIPVPTLVAEDETELATLNAEGKYPMAVKTSGQDANGRDNYRGALYNFEINAAGDAVTVTARSYSADSGYREPANLDSTYDNTSKIEEWTSTLYQEEYNELVESVIANKGFYVGRYESGNLDSTAVSKVGATGINSQTWYQMYKAQKNIYGNVEGKKTHMIWGSQYDQVLIYLKDVPNTSSNVTNGKPFFVLNSIDMGVYTNNKSTYWDNETTKTTGKFNVKGIYDLGGNVYEWTVEAYNTSFRVCRGR